ncbi:hypothetical protein B0T16DRAFT_122291 [Cercophora newfieldiana]|uniref:WSC domain-containing protein n=1 Tax=Cercophora newfieldiana TaxID=92897 RepID=A0AA39YAC0_9PEZI|nr:hypothetical protein B0T16DRAFT_122291 [Cercophora newfieldiana]
MVTVSVPCSSALAPETPAPTAASLSSSLIISTAEVVTPVETLTFLSSASGTLTPVSTLTVLTSSLETITTVQPIAATSMPSTENTESAASPAPPQSTNAASTSEAIPPANPSTATVQASQTPTPMTTSGLSGGVTTPSTPLMTVTTTEISFVTTCPSASASYNPTAASTSSCTHESPPTSSPTSGQTAAPGNGGNKGPCPGYGYTCEDCLDGWFCPPSQTPALPAPCGTGWPCYHCSGGWFCVPSPTLVPTTVTKCPASLLRDAVFGETEMRRTKVTLTTTTVVMARSQATVTDISVPDAADWSYGGCYKDDAARSLKDSSITGPLSGGMTTEICVTFCRSQGFTLAGTKGSFQCFCGSLLLDSWLVEDSDCDQPCTGDSSQFCGGTGALSIWSPDGKVRKDISPEHRFVMPTPTPGQTEMVLDTGGLRRMVVKITTPVEVWPAPAATTLNPATSENLAQPRTYVAASSPGADLVDVDRIDVNGIASTVHAIVSAAIQEAHAIAASEIARANSMIAGARAVVGKGFDNMAEELNAVIAEAFPERVAWTTCSTTITVCSTTSTCTETDASLSSPAPGSGLQPNSPGATPAQPSPWTPSTSNPSDEPSGTAAAAPQGQSPTPPTPTSSGPHSALPPSTSPLNPTPLVSPTDTAPELSNPAGTVASTSAPASSPGTTATPEIESATEQSSGPTSPVGSNGAAPVPTNPTGQTTGPSPTPTSPSFGSPDATGGAKPIPGGSTTPMPTYLVSDATRGAANPLREARSFFA